MKVLTNIAGSHLVIQHGRDSYLDAKKYARYPHMTFIEVVRSGQVIFKDCEFDKRAPERIMEVYREHLLGVPNWVTAGN